MAASDAWNMGRTACPALTHPLAAQERRVRDHFETNAGDYFETHSGEAGGAREIRDRYLAALGARLTGASALDVACGPGNFAAWAARRVKGPVVGLDFSAAMIRIAKERFSDVDFVVGDARRLPFASGAYDVVYSFRSLQHVPDMEGAIAEMARVAAPGGALLFDFVNAWNPLGALRSTASVSRRFIYLRAHTRRAIGALCARLGLVVDEWLPIQLLADSANARKYFGARPLAWLPRLFERANEWSARCRFLDALALRVLVVAKKPPVREDAAPAAQATVVDDPICSTAS
ncbi:MAG: methyltransferase domain-containing protein [Planctomycetes bacterium]|nr:methyltransferase domain-containing protein [Planctomycetota bacterium]